MNPFDICLAKQLVGESGGGNPNYVQTITGTLDDPWGDVNYAELLAAVYSGNATAILTFDAAALGYGEYTTWLNVYFVGSEPQNLYAAEASLAMDVESSDAYTFVWHEGITARILADDSIIDIAAYASLVPTTLTIIWHPLP